MTMNRQARIVTDALRNVESGDDLDIAFERARCATPCAPGAAAMARAVFIAIVTRPEVTHVVAV